jgi:HD superfamily phosphodiesterase
MDLGCAKWCALAEQCLGFVPDRESLSSSQEGALAGRLIQCLGEELKGDQTSFALALKAFYHAKELVSQEGGDPRMVLAAALLLGIGGSSSDTNQAPETGGLQKVQQILQVAGADEQTINRICEFIEAHLSGNRPDSIESRIVRDAARLAKFSADGAGHDVDELDKAVRSQLSTESAKNKVRGWLQTRSADSEEDDTLNRRA